MVPDGTHSRSDQSGMGDPARHRVAFQARSPLNSARPGAQPHHRRRVRPHADLRPATQPPPQRHRSHRGDRPEQPARSRPVLTVPDDALPARRRPWWPPSAKANWRRPGNWRRSTSGRVPTLCQGTWMGSRRCRRLTHGLPGVPRPRRPRQPPMRARRATPGSAAVAGASPSPRRRHARP